MNLLYSDEPIIACSTNNTVNSGIAVLRLSGFKDIADLTPFFKLNLKTISARKVYFTKLIFENSILDEVLLTYFIAPQSYNGENILEISIHGNLINIENIISLFCDKANFRRAYPGEFTYRALKNNKLSLSQVEGLDLLLNATSSFALGQGLSILSGKIQDNYKQLYNCFLAHKSAIELSIDFLDDVGEEAANKLYNTTLDDLYSVISKLKSHINNTGTNLINPEITLVGLPNAGKSTLFNLLLNDDRAIVSSVAGTTRDYLSENIKLVNNFYRLIDTAGIRETENEIEYEGIKRSLSLIEKSFFKILVINPLEYDLKYFTLIKHLNFDLVIITHANQLTFKSCFYKLKEDLNNLNVIKEFNLGPIEPVFDGPIEPKYNVLVCDLLTHRDSIFDSISKRVNKKYLDEISNEPILIDRHRSQINTIYNNLRNYKDLSHNITDISIISSEFTIIGHCISELIGIVSPDDVLHNIFNNFCIGK
jgi:tRNA modification GTPase